MRIGLSSEFRLEFRLFSIRPNHNIYHHHNITISHHYYESLVSLRLISRLS